MDWQKMTVVQLKEYMRENAIKGLTGRKVELITRIKAWIDAGKPQRIVDNKVKKVYDKSKPVIDTPRTIQNKKRQLLISEHNKPVRVKTPRGEDLDISPLKVITKKAVSTEEPKPKKFPKKIKSKIKDEQKVKPKTPPKAETPANIRKLRKIQKRLNPEINIQPGIVDDLKMESFMKTPSPVSKLPPISKAMIVVLDKVVNDVNDMFYDFMDESSPKKIEDLAFKLLVKLLKLEQVYSMYTVPKKYYIDTVKIRNVVMTELKQYD